MHHNVIIKDGDTTKAVKKVLVDGVQFVDETPRAGSTNFVTSGGVNKAIGDTKESVDEDVQDLQQQIDDIAEKAGSGYIPKGEASVATLNGLSGQENGELYTMTDAGTLTLGSLAVVAGDTVAWDEANSVWYKAMDYAPRQYGTNEVHNLSTTITAFRTGDVIPVDGPSCTAKMAAEAVLQIASGQNVVKSGFITGNHDYTLVQVYGNVGDVVSIDYSFGAISSLVAVPEGGSATALVIGDWSGHYDYTLTTTSATFGVYSSTSDVSYTLSVRSGVKKDVYDVGKELQLVERSNLYITRSGTLATTYDYKIISIEGRVGDKVYIDYTTSASSTFVVVPEGGSATPIKTGGTGGSLEYTMTATAATFGIFGNVGMTYTINFRAGLSSEIKQCSNRVDKLEDNLEQIVSGTLATQYNYHLVTIEGRIGDKVYIDYTTSSESSLVVVPLGGSATPIKNGGTGGSVEYTLTTTSADFGFFGSVGMDYTINFRAGLSSEIRQCNNRIDDVELNVGSVAKYTGTLSTYNYKIAYLNGNVGDKFYIGFTTNHDANLVIGNTAVFVSKTTGWYEYTMTSTRIGVGFFVFQETDYTLEIRGGIDGRVINLEDETVNFKKKKLLVMGDSISTSPYYIKYLRNYFSEYRNTAVVSATWADRSGTSEYDGNPSTDVPVSNVMGNQVQRVKNNWSSWVPDIILMAAGINDADISSSDVDESLFISGGSYVDMGTATWDSSDHFVSERKTISGAVRYCVTELQKLYPNAKIFLCTPIQDSLYYRSYDSIKIKQTLISNLSDRMGVGLIDVGRKCGIYGDFEYQGSNWVEVSAGSLEGRDLRDGLHPNDNGSKKMASCIFRELVSHFADTSEL